MPSNYLFFKEVFKNLKTLGTITPSSHFLVDKMLRDIDFSKAKIILEFGPGNGIITKKILQKLHKEAVLICFEVNDTLFKELNKIKHSQLKVLNASAENIKEELNKLGYTDCCHVISSLPLSNISNKISNNILQRLYAILKNNGTYTQFQYTLSYYKKIKSVFHKSVSLDFEILNVPPAFIYRCKKVS